MSLNRAAEPGRMVVAAPGAAAPSVNYGGVFSSYNGAASPVTVHTVSIDVPVGAQFIVVPCFVYETETATITTATLNGVAMTINHQPTYIDNFSPELFVVSMSNPPIGTGLVLSFTLSVAKENRSLAAVVWTSPDAGVSIDDSDVHTTANSTTDSVTVTATVNDSTLVAAGASYRSDLVSGYALNTGTLAVTNLRAPDVATAYSFRVSAGQSTLSSTGDVTVTGTSTSGEDNMTAAIILKK